MQCLRRRAAVDDRPLRGPLLRDEPPSADGPPSSELIQVSRARRRRSTRPRAVSSPRGSGVDQETRLARSRIARTSARTCRQTTIVPADRALPPDLERPRLLTPSNKRALWGLARRAATRASSHRQPTVRTPPRLPPSTVPQPAGRLLPAYSQRQPKRRNTLTVFPDRITERYADTLARSARTGTPGGTSKQRAVRLPRSETLRNRAKHLDVWPSPVRGTGCGRTHRRGSR
jgi:hypothetical protein